MFQLQTTAWKLIDHELWVGNEFEGCSVIYLNVVSITYSAGSVSKVTMMIIEARIEYNE
jgi:hypothetical protein